MGGLHSKKRKNNVFEKDVKGLKEKIRFIQEEMNEIVYEREKEGTTYEREMMVFAFKEAEWKQERKKLREEVKMLKKMVEEKEEKIREVMEDGGKLGVGEKKRNEKELGFLGSSFLVEQMKEERARRDETVEKWKQLYLAIKVELDDLIQRTHRGAFLSLSLYTRTHVISNVFHTQSFSHTHPPTEHIEQYGKVPRLMLLGGFGINDKKSKSSPSSS